MISQFKYVISMIHDFLSNILSINRRVSRGGGQGARGPPPPLRFKKKKIIIKKGHHPCYLNCLPVYRA